jgi:preprotein translocase subunit YajC
MLRWSPRKILRRKKFNIYNYSALFFGIFYFIIMKNAKKMHQNRKSHDEMRHGFFKF